MIKRITRYKKFIIIISILIFVIGSWYFFNNRDLEKTPQSADLVIEDIFTENMEKYDGK